MNLLKQADFKRGQVYWVKFPEPKFNPTDSKDKANNPLPHTVIKGWHMAICLTNHDDVGASDKHVVVVPVSKSSTAVAADTLLPTHIPIQKSDYAFLSEDSYALAFQPITIPSHWLFDVKCVGEFQDEIMQAVDVALWLSTGSQERVKTFIARAVQETIQEILQETGVNDTASSEK